MNKYASKIKDLKITKVTGEITSISKPVTLVNGILKVNSPGYTSAEWSFSNEALTVGEKFTIGN